MTELESTYYKNAAFREGVDFLVGDSRAVFSYDLVSFDVELNESAADEVERLCVRLCEEDGLDVSDVISSFGSFSPYVWELLSAFDRYGFLTEKSIVESGQVISGALFWQQVDAFSNRAKEMFRPVFFSAMLSGMTSRGSLLRYAFEYYHIVKHGPSIIAGALAHSSTMRTQTILEQFLSQELGHERLLLQALTSEGFEDDEIVNSTPLPETFCLIAAIQTLSDQDPLAFKSVAFLLEEASPDFHDAFQKACHHVGLTEGFWGPIVRHADINEDGEHGHISKKLLSELNVVTEEERINVLKHVAHLIECLVALEHAILDPKNGI